mgnify:FL=1
MKITPKKHIGANVDLESTDFVKLYEVMSQREVADKLGITQAAVSFLEKKALTKFRQRLFFRKIYNLKEII